MNKEYYMVLEFHKKANQKIGNIEALTKKERQTRYNFMLEELNEFMEANDIVEQTDAIIDLIYFALGTLVEIGIPPDKPFEIVHNANMTKFSDGIKKREDGKVIKPKTFIPPQQKIKEHIEQIKK